MMEYLDVVASAKIRIVNGLPTFLQLTGMVMNLCDVSARMQAGPKN